MTQVIVQAGVVSAFGATPGLVIGMTAASLAGAECIVRSSGRAGNRLDESGLTSGDLQKVSAALSAALMAMHHRRMTYPPTRTTSPPRRRLTLIPRLIGRARS